MQSNTLGNELGLDASRGMAGLERSGDGRRLTVPAKPAPGGGLRLDRVDGVGRLEGAGVATGGEVAVVGQAPRAPETTATQGVEMGVVFAMMVAGMMVGKGREARERLARRLRPADGFEMDEATFVARYGEVAR